MLYILFLCTGRVKKKSSQQHRASTLGISAAARSSRPIVLLLPGCARLLGRWVWQGGGGGGGGGGACQTDLPPAPPRLHPPSNKHSSPADRAELASRPGAERGGRGGGGAGPSGLCAIFRDEVTRPRLRQVSSKVAEGQRPSLDSALQQLDSQYYLTA